MIGQESPKNIFRPQASTNLLRSISYPSVIKFRLDDIHCGQQLKDRKRKRFKDRSASLKNIFPTNISNFFVWYAKQLFYHIHRGLIMMIHHSLQLLEQLTELEEKIGWLEQMMEAKQVELDKESLLRALMQGQQEKLVRISNRVPGHRYDSAAS
jgi:hypothetical protein